MRGFAFTIILSSLLIGAGLLFAGLLYLTSRRSKQEGGKPCDGGLQ